MEHGTATQTWARSLQPLPWDDLKPHQNNSSAPDMYRQTQDSGTSGQGPKQTSANYNNVVFTPVFVFFALV